MQEATATETTRRAIETAHEARAAAFAAVISFPFRALRALWPQDSSRRWQVSPQGCPAGR